MTSRRPSFSRKPRPSSAIYIGSESTPPLLSPPSPAHSSSSTRSHLPSPPASNSTGSIGDSNSTGTGSVRRSGMVKDDSHLSLSDEENDINEQIDEDHTAKLSNDTQIAKGKQPESSSSTIQRVKSLTERNRQVIDRLSSITASDSHSRSSLSPHSGASSSRSRSPILPTFSPASSSSATGSSSRVSFTGSLRGGSGSETEREQRNTSRSRPVPPQDVSSDDNDAITPPATSRKSTPTLDHTGPRQRLRSAPSPAKPPFPLSPRKHTSTTNFAAIGSGRRSRRVSIQQSGESLEEEEGGSSPMHPTVGAGTNKKSRAPLPREFRDRDRDRGSLDEKSPAESSTRNLREQERNTSPGVLTARGAASANSSGAGATFSSPVSPRSQRPARPSTVRESSRRLQRWNSVDDAANGEEDGGRRQWRQTGSAESPLGGKEGRSVVGEGLRAAGLARRGSADVFANGLSQRRTHNSVGPSVNSNNNAGVRGDLDELRRDVPRGLGLSQDPRTPLTAPPGPHYDTIRNNTIHSVLSGNASRAGTSMGSYADDDAPRSISQPLRSHRTSYGPGARHTPQSHASPPLGTFGRGTPSLASATPSSEHARLMIDSLTMFEAQLSRLPPGPPDLMRSAQGVVQSANALNTLLRAGNARALEAQIEAEVGDADPQVDASEVWRQVGGEYRESVRMSDELVRTITALLLGVGRLVREAHKERSTDSPDIGSASGRSSLDGDENRSARVSRRSMDGGGRGSADGSTYRASRRSGEDVESSRRSHVDLNSRPPTSLSMTRSTTRQDEGSEIARERERPSPMERLSLRRMFTPRSRESNRASATSLDSPDPNHPTPTPAPRSSLEREYRPSRHSLAPLTVPPPLPSLPSESLLTRNTSTKTRRAKVSNTSNTTVRGTSAFSPMTSPPNPTTALTPHTVSASESTAFPLFRGDSSSNALSGLQQQQQRDVRKRTASNNSAQDAPVSQSSGSSGTRARDMRIRTSLDSAQAPQDRFPLPSAQLNGTRLERRRTINEIFP